MEFNTLKQRKYIEKLVKENPYSMFYFENSDLGFYLLCNYFFKKRVKSKEDIKNIFPTNLKEFIAERKRKIKYDLCCFADYTHTREDRLDARRKRSEIVFYIVSDGVTCPADKFNSQFLTEEFHESMNKIKNKYNINRKKLNNIVNWCKFKFNYTKKEVN